MENWKLIEGCSNYEVSDRGNIRNILTERILKPMPCGRKPNGTFYLKVGLVNDCGKKVQKMVHRLVAEAFIPNPNNYPQVNHRNGDKTCNEVWNLEWVTCKQNIKHAKEIGLAVYAIGAKAGAAKLTDEDVMSIRKRVANGESQYKIAKEYKVTQGAINHIVLGRTWKHLPIVEYTPFSRNI